MVRDSTVTAPLIPMVESTLRSNVPAATWVLRDCTASSVTGPPLNVAVMVVAMFTVTLQVPVPGHPASLQPTKVEPIDGVAVRISMAPGATEATQVPPQSMPAGEEVTVPVPTLPTVRLTSATPTVFLSLTTCAVPTGAGRTMGPRSLSM